MLPRSRILLPLLLVVCFLVSFCQAQSTAPRIFYSDLQSGPATGGQNSRGAFVTIYGEGFGATQGSSTVTVGTTSAYSYPVWTDTQVSFQIDSTTALGSNNIVVNVGGITSNALPFVVRSGRIYFVSTSGRDSQKGSYSRPWRTLAKAVKTMVPGDITYAMGNLVEGATGTGAASLPVARAGSPGQPFALVEYPGATATIGSATGPSYGVQATAGGYSYWVVAGFIIRGALGAVDLTGATNWRLVRNDISCPNGYGAGGCVRASSSSGLSMLGNRVHDSGSTTSTDVSSYDSVEISASTNVETGWNTITNTRSCRALRFASTGTAVYGLAIHDNYVQNSVCDGISLANLDPTQGAVQIYNNVVERAGTGPAPGGVESTYACIAVGGTGLGSVLVHHNTAKDCGARANADSGAILANTLLSLVNNVVSVNAGENYLTPNTSNSWLAGSNNLFYGAGAVPAPFTNSLNADPMFVDAGNHNLRLQPASPAIDTGIISEVKKDFDGSPRPQGASDDMGAFEFTGAPTTARLSFTQSTLAFGTITVGTTSTQTASLTNSGTVSATITQLNVTGPGFSVSGVTLPVTLAPGGSVSAAVTFAPTTSGAVSGSLTAATTAPASITPLQLTGTGAAPSTTLSVSSGSLSFGNVTTGTSASQTVTVTANSGSVTLSQVSTTGTGFTVTGPTLPLTLAAGQTASLTVTFAPTSTGVASGSLTVTSNATNSPSTVSLSGTGVAPIGTLTQDATTLGFGTVTVGSSLSLPVTFTATNGSVTISSATITGAGFSVSGATLPTTLAAGQSVTLTVKFAPTVTGTIAGIFSAVSNAPNTPNVVNVSGTGSAPIAHSVTLNWTASTSSGVVGYNVYRGSTSGGPYTKLGSQIAALTYTDSSLSAGATYYYVITSVDSSGTESGYSTQVAATVPTP